MNLIGSNLSDTEKTLIHDCWKEIMTDSKGFSKLFYKTLFTLNTTLLDLFPKNLTMQRLKLVDSLNYLVRRMSDTEETTKIIKHLGLRHKSYMMKPVHYTVFGEAMLLTLREFLGSAFTEECSKAWSKLYNSVANVMILGAKRK